MISPLAYIHTGIQTGAYITEWRLDSFGFILIRICKKHSPFKVSLCVVMAKMRREVAV